MEVLVISFAFSPRDKFENGPTNFSRSADCPRRVWVHRLRDGFSVSNALLLGQSFQRSSAITDKIGDGTVSRPSFQLFRCSSRTVRLSFGLFCSFWICHSQFYTSSRHTDHAG
jgi:hypothetical protein